MIIKQEHKRRFTRIEVKAPFRYQIRGASEFRNTIADNISLGGIGFISDRFISPATCLNMEINILSRIINSVGRVVWAAPLPHSDRYRLGIEFLELNQLEKNYISDYINMQTGNF